MTDTSGPPGPSEVRTTVPVWDLPVRLFHWVLAIVVCTAWYIGDNRTFTNIDYHFYLGYAVGALVVFRLLWGFIGSRPARLSSLFHGPGAIWSYVRTLPKRGPSNTIGHNPLGSLSVIALLLSLAVQVTTGLFAEDDGLFASGPLAEYVSGSTITQMNQIHFWNSRVLLFLVATHVLAVLFYLLWKRENLVGPMITGRKSVPASAAEENDTRHGA